MTSDRKFLHCSEVDQDVAITIQTGQRQTDDGVYSFPVHSCTGEHLRDCTYRDEGCPHMCGSDMNEPSPRTDKSPAPV